MSNEFLTRRMDLIHSIDTTNKVNILKMDTSYPVKVKGIICKYYVATAQMTKTEYAGFSLDKVVFKIQNQAGDLVVDITKRHTYDMSGEMIDELPAIDKYVQIIVDIDNESIYLAPLDEIGGGSFKSYKRLMYRDPVQFDTKPIVGDPVIDLEDASMREFYNDYFEKYTGLDPESEDAYGVQKPNLPVEVSEFKTNRQRGSVITVMNPEQAYSPSGEPQEKYRVPSQLFYFDIDNSNKTTDHIQQMPTLFVEIVNPTTVSENVTMAPVDIASPGTLKMFETDVQADYDEIHNMDTGTVSNKLAVAATKEKLFENYSFVRDALDKVVYEFYEFTPRIEGASKGKKITPVAKVEIEDANRLQSNLVVAAFCNPNSDALIPADMLSEIYDSYSNVTKTIALIQTVGNLSEEYEQKYGIPYDTDSNSLYARIMNPSNPDDPSTYNPVYKAPYPGFYFNVINEEGTTPDYYLVIGSTSGSSQLPTANSIKTIPVRKKDGYISISTQITDTCMVNGMPFDFNLEESVYAPFVRSFWWDDKCDGVTNKGFGHRCRDSHSTNSIYIEGSNSYIHDKYLDILYKFFDTDRTDVEDYRDFIKYLQPTFNPTGSTPSHNAEETYCEIKFVFNPEEIHITGDRGKTKFNFRPYYFEKEVDDMLTKIDTSDEVTEYQSEVGYFYNESTNECVLGSHIISPSATFDGYFKYTIKNKTDGIYYVDDAKDKNVFYKIQIIRIYYPHGANLNLSSESAAWEYTTVYKITRMYKCVYNLLPSPLVDTIAVNDNMYIRNTATRRMLYTDRNLTQPLTETKYLNDKSNYDGATYYTAFGSSSSTYSYCEFEVVFTFGADDAEYAARNDYYYLRPYKRHNYDKDSGTWGTVDTLDPDLFFIKSYRTLRIAPYASYQVVPSCKSFYRVKNPWPHPYEGLVDVAVSSNEYGIDFQRWLKSIPCWKLFCCSSAFGFSDEAADMARAKEKIRRLNGGISPLAVKYTDSWFNNDWRSAYEFLYNLLTRDVGNTVFTNPNKSYKTDIANNNFFFTNEQVEDWDTNRTDEKAPTAKWEFSISIENPSAPIDTALYEISDTDIDYSDNEANRINSVKIQTGLKTARALSITDEDGRYLSFLGTAIDNIPADGIIWKDLLNALNNNKTVDILGYLVGLKKYVRANLRTDVPHTQNHIAYALSVDSDENSSAVEISSVDRFGWSSTWADIETFYAMTKAIPQESNVWYYPNGSTPSAIEFPVVCMDGTLNSLAISDGKEIKRAFYYTTEVLSETDYNTWTSASVIRDRIVFVPMEESSNVTTIPNDEFDTIIAGFPCRCRKSSNSNKKFFIKDGFQYVLGRKYFYHQSIEHPDNSETNRHNPMAIGFFRIDGHHTSSNARKVEQEYPTSHTNFKTDYIDGLYYSTPNEGILCNTTRVLYFDPTKMIKLGSSNSIPLFKTNATGYSNLYEDRAISSLSEVPGWYSFEFDSKGRATDMKLVGADPQF